MTSQAVLLVHGLGGTEYDLGMLGKQLRQAGFDAHTLTLPGHGGKPEDLLPVAWTEWLDAVRERYRALRASHDTVHLVGMCMGALLAVEAAKREGHGDAQTGNGGGGRLVALAPPVFIDGWSTPWYRFARHVVYRIAPLARRVRVNEEEPYGVKNDRLRAIVKNRLLRGDGFHYPWVPLTCIREVDRLRRNVMRGLDTIACPTLVVHAREDELTSLRSAHFLVDGINAANPGQASLVTLDNSYHMICVDNDRERVANSVLEFLR
ncbi:MAG: Carboxylesterase [Paracidovorax wautersii]|uniref:Carboxylesterase n=1 Tax=Paracidovorax wautersii TaxID=1177982 RepID=A0A7V8FNC3_9BURK|nr:MAG: Carboxylesterase [Paracidovorax wautersii]